MENQYTVIVTPEDSVAGGSSIGSRLKQRHTIRLPFIPQIGMQLLDIETESGVFTVRNVIYGTKSGIITITVR